MIIKVIIVFFIFAEYFHNNLLMTFLIKEKERISEKWE